MCESLISYLKSTFLYWLPSWQGLVFSKHQLYHWCLWPLHLFHMASVKYMINDLLTFHLQEFFSWGSYIITWVTACFHEVGNILLHLHGWPFCTEGTIPTTMYLHSLCFTAWFTLFTACPSSPFCVILTQSNIFVMSVIKSGVTCSNYMPIISWHWSIFTSKKLPYPQSSGAQTLIYSLLSLTRR